MREIKFRAWDGASLHYGGFSIHATGKVEGIGGLSGVDGGSQIMQFTGLHDKNGAEIYEGDIVRYLHKYDDDLSGAMGCEKDEKVSVVEWSDVSRSLGWYGSVGAFNPERHEVIGNIHQTPELAEA